MHPSPLWLAAAALVAGQTSSPLPRSNPMSSTTPRETVHELRVLDTFISYRETGTGSPIVFLHGNPTSSYVWRNVVPLVAGRGRCLAPDLVGMGRSGKPESAYRFRDHARYLDAWFAGLDLRDVVLVGYDWGGVLALDWASRHPDRVRGVVVFETFLRPSLRPVNGRYPDEQVSGTGREPSSRPSNRVIARAPERSPNTLPHAV